VRIQGVKQRLVVSHMCGGLIKHDNVEARKPLFVLPERLSHQALEPVSADGLPTVFFRNGKTESCLVAAVFSIQDGEKRVFTSSCLLEHPTKRFLVQQSVLPLELAAGNRCFGGGIVVSGRNVDVLRFDRSALAIDSLGGSLKA